MSILVLFEGGRWLRVMGDEIVSRGIDVADLVPLAEGETVVAVMPAREVSVTAFDLPDLSDAQARAAARLAASETSLTPLDGLHVATGLPDATGQRSAVIATTGRVAETLRLLADLGIDPDHLLAAPMLLPRPDFGFVRGELDDEMIVRGRDGAFLDDPEVTPLIVGDSAVVTLDRSALEAALIAAVAVPEADLRHGIFARRRRWAVDVARVRRAAVLALVTGGLVLATQVVSIVRINTTAATIEAESRTAAAALLPPGSVVTDPATQAETRLASVAGAAGGFGPLAAVFAGVTSATPGVELGSLVFDGETGLRATVRAMAPADLSAVEVKLAAAGLAPTAAPIVTNQGKAYRDIVVRAR